MFDDLDQARRFVAQMDDKEQSLGRFLQACVEAAPHRTLVARVGGGVRYRYGDASAVDVERALESIGTRPTVELPPVTDDDIRVELEEA
jgi:hypothetical protein